MSPVPGRILGDAIDLSPRVTRSAAVVASPAAAAETIIAQITLTQDLAVGSGIILLGYAAYTVGAAGTNVNLRIRRTSVAGTIVKATGGMTRAAAALHADSVYGFDTGVATAGAIYCLTMIVTAGAAESTVSAVELIALVI